ncbi:hypothetical protein BDV96DRAFT_568994 [Lophiotrema nucula]|uniref:Uncharacterized protein n=1 Tax=Lophiotrema nucula TaxID=690887 RepID=A0A6A5ZKW5_9PLEO|nr:hypothetical protein BDV96DRAFT_568994 [Lophiotrema nucula]
MNGNQPHIQRATPACPPSDCTPSTRCQCHVTAPIAVQPDSQSTPALPHSSTLATPSCRPQRMRPRS